MRVKICFVIRQLNMGGAQRQLLNLIAALSPAEFDVSLVTFYRGGEFEADARAIRHLRLFCIDKRGRYDLLGAARRFLKVLRQVDPDVLHGYLYLGNLACLWARRFLRRRPLVVWGLRSSNTHLEHYSRADAILGWLEKSGSPDVDLAIANSQAGYDYARARGHTPRDFAVVANGIDTERFQRDAAARQELRRSWQAAADDPVIGIVGRLDPKKGHRLFLEAAALFLKTHSGARFVVVGEGREPYLHDLQGLAESLGLAERVQWLGSRKDLPRIYSALDLVALCSNAAEGFPNVVAEALACETLAAVTDSGDAARVVPSREFVAAEATPRAVAARWAALLDGPYRTDPASLRDWIVASYSVARCAAETRRVLLDCFSRGRGRLQNRIHGADDASLRDSFE